MNRTLLALALLALSACKHEADVDLRTTDLMAAAKGAPDLTTRAILRVNSGSKAACAEHGASIAQGLSVAFADPQFIGCVERGMDSFAEYRVQIDIAPVDSQDTTGLYVGVTMRDDLVVAVLQIAPGAYDKVVAALPDRVRNSITGQQDISASVILQNDGDRDLTYTLTGAFRDGEPVAYYTDFPIKPRGEVKITLSDVSNAALARGAAPILILQP